MAFFFLCRVVREHLFDKVTFEQRHEESEEATFLQIWEKAFSTKEHKCKGSEALRMLGTLEGASVPE